MSAEPGGKLPILPPGYSFLRDYQQIIRNGTKLQNYNQTQKLKLIICSLWPLVSMYLAILAS